VTTKYDKNQKQMKKGGGLNCPEGKKARCRFIQQTSFLLDNAINNNKNDNVKNERGSENKIITIVGHPWQCGRCYPFVSLGSLLLLPNRDGFVVVFNNVESGRHFP
jgi:hypothetical protein